MVKEKDIDFEDTLWKAADRLRKKVEVHEYKYVVLGIIFLRYLSFAFEERREKLEREISNPKSEEYVHFESFRKQALEDVDRYLKQGVLFIPEEARWDFIVKNSAQPNIGELLDTAVERLEEQYPKQLKDAIPKIFLSINLDAIDLAYLINLFTSIPIDPGHKVKDVFGRVYEYFLGKFAETEGKKGGEFYTPRSLTKLIVDILDVKNGTIFDPSCGSGGFFVSALEKLENDGLDKNTLTIYGQESKPMPWKICKMNLALRGAEGDIRLGDSYHDDKFPELRANYVVSNPPFNDSGWGADRISYNDPRFKYKVPPDNNANFTWMQHYIFHLEPNYKAGYIMAKGALSGGNSEEEIRQKMIDDDLVYGIVGCPPKLFYNVPLAVSIWFLQQGKSESTKNKVLFIDARKTFKKISRKQVTFTEDQMKEIVQAFRLFEKGESEDKINRIGFSKVATNSDIAKNGYVLFPERYVGFSVIDDGKPFGEKIKHYSEDLIPLLKEEKEMNEQLEKILQSLNTKLEE